MWKICCSLLWNKIIIIINERKYISQRGLTLRRTISYYAARTTASTLKKFPTLKPRSTFTTSLLFICQSCDPLCDSPPTHLSPRSELQPLQTLQADCFLIGGVAEVVVVMVTCRGPLRRSRRWLGVGHTLKENEGHHSCKAWLITSENGLSVSVCELVCACVCVWERVLVSDIFTTADIDMQPSERTK